MLLLLLLTCRSLPYVLLILMYALILFACDLAFLSFLLVCWVHIFVALARAPDVCCYPFFLKGDGRVNLTTCCPTCDFLLRHLSCFVCVCVSVYCGRVRILVEDIIGASL